MKFNIIHRLSNSVAGNAIFNVDPKYLQCLWDGYQTDNYHDKYPKCRGNYSNYRHDSSHRNYYPGR